MPTPLITYGSAIAFAGSYTVATKAKFTDSWVANDKIIVDSVTWSVQPSTPTAILSFTYGPASEAGAATQTTRTRLSLEGYWVKIEVSTAESGVIREWIGFVDTVADVDRGYINIGGINYATGRQQFFCLGAIQALNYLCIDYTFYASKSTGTETVQRAVSSPIFNRLVENEDQQSEQTRTADKPAGQNSHLHLWRGIYGRTVNSADDPQPWSTKDIAEHLVDRYLVYDSSGANSIRVQWDTNALDRLPAGDKPQLDCDLKTLLQCLDQLISSDKLVGYYAEVQAISGNQTIVLKTFTYTDVAVATGAYTVPANADVANLSLMGDPATSYGTQLRLSQFFNQIRVRGAKRRVVCTVRPGPTGSTTYHLNPGWDPAAATRLASKITAIEASVASRSEQTTKVIAAYESPEYSQVFRAFVFRMNTYDWSIGGQALFEQEPDVAGTLQNYYPSPQHCRVLDYLPLYANVDYSAALPPSNPVIRPKEFLNPQVFCPEFVIDSAGAMVPQSTKQFLGHRLKQTYYYSPEHPAFDITVSPLREGVGILLDVSGASQYQVPLVTPGSGIPSASYHVPHHPLLPADQLWVTICLEEDRHIEKFWPTTTTGLDVVRQLVINSPNHRYDRVLGGALLWTNETVFEVPSTTVLKNDETELLAMAKRASNWFTKARRVLSVASKRHTSLLKLGTFIQTIEPTTVQSEAVNTVITQINISFAGGQPPAVQFETQSGELDPIAFLSSGWRS